MQIGYKKLLYILPRNHFLKDTSYMFFFHWIFYLVYCLRDAHTLKQLFVFTTFFSKQNLDALFKVINNIVIKKKI